MFSMNITIDGKSCSANSGETVLDAARRNGCSIPALCYNISASETPLTSCLVCLVKINGRFVPSCATQVVDGMTIESETEEVKQLRKTALELLLSEHSGECYAPCQLACPAHLDIPLMLRQMDGGDNAAAIRTIKKTIPLPAVLGRVCSKPCEKVCRRKEIGSAVNICAAKCYAADIDLAAPEPYQPRVAPPTGKSVAVVGAGPMGLSAAFYLALNGHQISLCSLGKPIGERLREYSADVLPPDVLNAEIQTILKLLHTVDDSLYGDPMNELASPFTAVLDCTESNRTKPPMVIRSIADGQEAAERIHAFLTTGKDKPVKPFYVASRCNTLRSPTQETVKKTTEKDGVSHSSRCLYCGCRGRDKCKLLKYAAEYQADTKQFDQKEELCRPIQAGNGSSFVFEAGKCIRCGLCVAVARKHGEELGLTFLNRGSNVHVGVPFNEPLEKGLTKSVAEACAACPTGALVFLGH